MAYLKGGTYVDGDLYVEENLLVGNIKTSSGEDFPHVSDRYQYKPGALLRCLNASREMGPASIVEIPSEAAVEEGTSYENIVWQCQSTDAKADGPYMFTMDNIASKNIRVFTGSDIKLDPNSSTWKFE